MKKRKTIAVGVTGGIAAYKVIDLVSSLKKRGYEVEVIMTEAAQKLVAPLTFRVLSGHDVHTDLFGSDGPADEVEHIAIADRADLIVVVPATADIMAKAAAGIGDDLLSTVLLAAKTPPLFFPAMHTRMWEHAATQANVRLLRERGCTVVEPAAGVLACGAVGKGRLGEIKDIEGAIVAALAEKRDLCGKTVLISAGPTEEPIDAVRCITNRSSGKMGYALATAALRRGADVELVSGPVHLDAPTGAKLHRVKTALEMQETMASLCPAADITVMAAAVGDYRAAEVAAEKIKKDGGNLHLELVPNPDILASLAAGEHGYLVGFAAETEHLLKNGNDKLQRKGVDMIVANDVAKAGAGFDVDTNIAAIITEHATEELPLMTKAALADVIFDRILYNMEENSNE